MLSISVCLSRRSGSSVGLMAAVCLQQIQRGSVTVTFEKNSDTQKRI